MTPPPLAPAAAAAGGAPALPPPFTGAESAFVPYLVGGGPAGGARMTMRAAAPVADRHRDATEAAETVAAAAGQTRRRRQRTALTDPGHRYEYLDPADTPAAEHGAGRMGFPGTAGLQTGSAVTGLTTLTESAAGPPMPMLPHTWETPADPDQLT